MKSFVWIVVASILFSVVNVQGQTPETKAQINGNLETHAKFFLRDSAIGAVATPQTERQLFGTETWLNLSYAYNGFDIGVRFDAFANSNLLNPQGSYTDLGIGRWYVNKSIEKLDITAGYIYDQIGSGIAFRSYEERPLAIDNALVGLRLKYHLSDDWTVKGFTGRQKQQLGLYEQAIRGLAIDGFYAGDREGLSLAPGLGIIARTLDDATMDALVATINTYSPKDAIVPTYNAYAASLYNTLTAGNFSWYVEGAYKTAEALRDPLGTFLVDTVLVTGEKLIKKPGHVVYTSMSYAAKGLGLTLEAKRTEHFSWRTTPLSTLQQGLMNFLPPLTRVNTYRLTSRYFAATQELGELAFQLDARYALKKKWNINANASYINDLEGVPLYREAFLEVGYKKGIDFTLTVGLQHQYYNQQRYEQKTDAQPLKTITPFVDFTRRFSRRYSMHLELQALIMDRRSDTDALKDYGHWVYGGAEFFLAPNWSFGASDMYNVSPGENAPVLEGNNEAKATHYPRVDINYSRRSNRFSLSYIKQVAGIVCAGGICRLEPAFSGVRFSVLSGF